MLYNLIVDDCGIDRHEHEPFTLSFYTAYENAKEAEDAARRAVCKFLMTQKGVEARRHNCGYFNWGDVACHVPDSYYVVEGLIPISVKEEMSSVVMRDEDLTGAEDEFLIEAKNDIRLSLDDITNIIVSALRSYNGSRFTFSTLAPVKNENLDDYVWQILSDNDDLALLKNEDESYHHALNAAKFLTGFKAWFESGFDTKRAVSTNGSVNAEQINAEEADRILRFALLPEKEAFEYA